MAVRALTTIASMRRTASLPAVQPLTMMASYYSQGNAAGAFRDLLSIHKTLGANEFTDPYVWVGLDTTDGRTIQLEVWDGASSFIDAGPQISAGAPFHLALRINGDLHEVLYSDGGANDATVICSVNQPNNIGTLGVMYFYAEVDGGGKIRITNGKVFSDDLTAAAIRLERDSYAITDTANDYSAPRFRWRADITDSSGNARHWTQALGTLEDIDGFPTLAPSNISAPMATAMGTTLPYNATQDSRVSGISHPLWFKRTALTGEKWIGVFGFGYTSGYRPRVEVQVGNDPYALVDVTENGFDLVANNLPIQLQQTEGETYYFEFDDTQETDNPAVLTLNVQLGPDHEVPAGAIAVPDDFFTSLVFLSPTVDYEVLNIVEFAPGEGGDVLPNGIVAVDDRFNNRVTLYDAADDMAVLAYVAVDAFTNGGSVRANPTLSKFFVASNTNPITITAISDEGVETATYTLTGQTAARSIAVSNDESILYWTRSTGTVAEIRRWDLVNGVALSSLANYGSLLTVMDIIVLADDTILAIFSQPDAFPPGGTVIVRRFDPDGTVLNTYDFSAEPDLVWPVNTTEPRLARAINDPISFWLWTHHADAISRFRNIRISNGATLSSVDHAEFEVGSYIGVESADAPRFGNPVSCPFFVMPLALGADGGGGDIELGVIGPLVWVEWPRRVP